MRLLIGIVIAIVFAGCSSGDHSLKKGIWRGVIEIQPGQELPFTFEVVTAQDSSYDVYLKNAEEKILLDEVSYEGDSIVMTLHVFDAVLKAKADGDKLNGFYIKNYEKNYRIPFTAYYGQDYRFDKTSATAEVDFTGKYAVTFTNESDTTVAVGIFKQDGNHVIGTFLTTTGDYRFIEGSVVGKKMHISTFDGNHAYLFTAEKNSDTKITGEYWSGKTWHQAWTGVKDENAALPDAESLTYLKPGYDKIEFTFPDVNGKSISLADEKYHNKVVVLQIFGTWCPNCLDETKFLKTWYEKNSDRGVEIIGLAYERKPDFAYASERVKKMQGKLNVPYDFVIAGINDKAKAAETLPMLNTIVAFPTTIFVGKDGKVKKIHTGFSGPGTGVYYDQFVQHFNETINELLAENPALSKK